MTRGHGTHEEAIATGRDEGAGGRVGKPNALTLKGDGGLPHCHGVKGNAARHSARAILYQKACWVGALHSTSLHGQCSIAVGCAMLFVVHRCLACSGL